MGTTVEVEVPLEGGTRKTVSEAGIKFIHKYGKHTMGATYANPGGDTVSMPDVPPGYTLWCVNILAAPGLPAGYSLVWDGSETTPKIIAYDEDGTSGIQAELTNSSAALAAVELYLDFIYKTTG